MMANTGQAEGRGATRRLLRNAAWLGLLIALCGLHFWRLDTDAYRALSWDTGLFTDEGFYTHAARNVTLFGRARTDDFNNSLLMPPLHYLQVFVFRAFGYGILQARLISITLGLLTLPVFYAAMKRAFGPQTARYAVLFLGLEHVPFLYSRMALMDTAAAFLLVCAFYAFTILLTKGGRRAAIGATACGLTLGLLYATRGLAAVAIPAPFIALLLPLAADEREKISAEALTPGPSSKPGRGETENSSSLRRRGLGGGLFASLLLALAIYAVVWYLPHHAELARVNRYHVREQLLPRTAHQLGLNIGQAVAGVRYLGLLPYLFAHSPVLLLLTISLPFFKRGSNRLSDVEMRCVVYCAMWLIAFFGLFAFVNYAPSRYYVLFYPALCGLAAVGVRPNPPAPGPGNPQRGGEAGEGSGDNTPLPTLGDPQGKEKGVGGGSGASRFYPISSQCDRLRLLSPPSNRRRAPHSLRGTSVSGKGAGGLGFLLTLWAVINLGWYVDWARNLTTTQRDASEKLARTLPPNSVLLGDCAPGLGLYNRFVTVNVMPGLCNDRAPLERFAGRPRYVVILDGAYKRGSEKWWITHYPNVMREQNRLFLFNPLVSHPVGVYKVEAKDAVWRPDESP